MTATVENGTATIKITDPAAQSAVTQVTGTTVANTNKDTDTTKVNPAILALFNRTQSEQDPTGTATGKDCKDEPKAVSDQVKRVNDAFKTDMQALEKLSARTDAAKKAVDDAEKAIKGIRQTAVKAIHATAPTTTVAKCDEDHDKDVEETEGDNHDMKHEAEDEDGEHEDDDKAAAPVAATPTTPSVVFNGDAKAIADQAIAAMALWVKDAKAVVDAQPASTATNGTKLKAEKAKHDSKGNGDHKN